MSFRHHSKHVSASVLSSNGDQLEIKKNYAGEQMGMTMLMEPVHEPGMLMDRVDKHGKLMDWVHEYGKLMDPAP